MYGPRSRFGGAPIPHPTFLLPQKGILVLGDPFPNMFLYIAFDIFGAPVLLKWVPWTNGTGTETTRSNKNSLYTRKVRTENVGPLVRPLVLPLVPRFLGPANQLH